MPAFAAAGAQPGSAYRRQHEAVPKSSRCRCAREFGHTAQAGPDRALVDAWRAAMPARPARPGRHPGLLPDFQRLWRIDTTSSILMRIWRPGCAARSPAGSLVGLRQLSEGRLPRVRRRLDRLRAWAATAGRIVALRSAAGRTGIAKLKIGYWRVSVTISAGQDSRQQGARRLSSSRPGEQPCVPELKSREEISAEERLQREIALRLRQKAYDNTRPPGGRAVLAAVDVCASRRAAGRHGWCRPEMLSEPILDIQDGQSRGEASWPATSFPIWIWMRGRNRSSRPVGAVTYLRQAALIVLLTGGQLRSAAQAQVGIADRIFAGRRQRQPGSITFLIGMETAAICLVIAASCHGRGVGGGHLRLRRPRPLRPCCEPTPGRARYRQCPREREGMAGGVVFLRKVGAAPPSTAGITSAPGRLPADVGACQLCNGSLSEHRDQVPRTRRSRRGQMGSSPEWAPSDESELDRAPGPWRPSISSRSSNHG
jgi:hypothetical protein